MLDFLNNIKLGMMLLTGSIVTVLVYLQAEGWLPPTSQTFGLFVLIIIDTATGITVAKHHQERISSYKFRRLGIKIIQYFTALLVVSAFCKTADLAADARYYATLTAFVLIALMEGKSIAENMLILQPKNLLWQWMDALIEIRILSLAKKLGIVKNKAPKAPPSTNDDADQA